MVCEVNGTRISWRDAVLTRQQRYTHLGNRFPRDLRTEMLLINTTITRGQQ